MRRRKKNKKKIFILSLLTVTVFGVAYGTLVYSKQQIASHDTGMPQISLVEDLMSSSQVGGESYLTGKVEPKAVSRINTDPTKGNISQIHVKEGDSVNKDQKLFTYSNVDGQMAMGDADINLSKSQNKINQLSESVGYLQEQVNKRYNELEELKGKIANASEPEKANLEQQKTGLEDALYASQTELDAKNNELNDAYLDYNQAESTKNLTDQKYDGQDVLSTVDGIVQSIDESQSTSSGSNGNSGETKPFMEVMDTSSLNVRGTVDEFKKDGLAAGQTVKVIDRKDQSKQWNGKLTKVDTIANESEEEGTVSKYNYEVEILDKDKLPNIGNHVYIKPEKEKSEKINVPEEYVFEENSKKWVWKVDSGVVKKQEITIEETKEKSKTVDVLTGLDKKDQIVFPTEKITDGMKVNAK